MRNSRYSTLLRIVLGLVMIAGLLYWGADFHDRVILWLHADRLSRDPFSFDADSRKIGSVQPEAEHAGLAKGDILESLNGSPYTGLAQWDEITNTAPPGEVVDVGFRRPDGREATASIMLVPDYEWIARSGWKGLLQQSMLFMPALVCMLVAYWVVLAKPAEPNAWLILLLLCFPEIVFALGTGLATGGWLFFREFYYRFFQEFGPLALLPFGIYFPERSRVDVKLPWLKWVILLPAIACGILSIGLAFRRLYFGGAPPWLVRIETTSDRIENALALACVILYLLLIFDKLRSASSQDARRRLRVLIAGTGFGGTVLLVVFVLLPHFGIHPNAEKHLWLAYTGALLFLVAPLTLGYVVLVQRAMDVRILLRTGTKYALARATLISAQFILGAIISLTLLVPLTTQKHISTDRLLGQTLLLACLLVVVRLAFSGKSKAWLDKKFFREAYDADRVLNELSAEVRKFTEAKPLLETVARCVAETLHVEQIGMLIRGEHSYRLSQSVGVVGASNGTLALKANSSTIRNLTNTNAPALLYRDDPDAWYLMADEEERRVLDTLDTELLLPLSGTQKLMGIMALGPKLSEAAYSKSDLRLLQTLATQTGLALEVSELAHSLAKEAAQRERVNREIEIAREVQERLFPQAMPAVPGGSVAGACRPAQGVGGDYYDVIPLEDGRLGIAIGDVSGKGISAALLMASLRASLRGVALDNPRDFARLMDKVNRLVYEASADNRYATFFFGAYDAGTGVLECVNAGHNAPVVLRGNGDGQLRVLRLEADGPVVGLLPFAPYSEQSLKLEPGDLLVAYTDGISEAMTHEEEEWGEERMIACAAQVKDKPAKEVLTHVFAGADTFTAGAPQHDDMTLLVLKLDVGAPQLRL